MRHTQITFKQCLRFVRVMRQVNEENFHTDNVPRPHKSKDTWIKERCAKSGTWADYDASHPCTCGEEI